MERRDSTVRGPTIDFPCVCVWVCMCVGGWVGGWVCVCVCVAVSAPAQASSSRYKNTRNGETKKLGIHEKHGSTENQEIFCPSPSIFWKKNTEKRGSAQVKYLENLVYQTFLLIFIKNGQPLSSPWKSQNYWKTQNQPILCSIPLNTRLSSSRRE